ncbi:transporter [Rivularia sp. IAM M-261]|nr:transporter [Rivularia sp. IAM M-261]
MSKYRYLIIAGISGTFLLSNVTISSAQTISQSTQSQSASPNSTSLDNLNPNSNPLQFPTKSEEVKIQLTQPITLEQALELARRNNRELQIGILTLERSRAALREAQAALYPNVGLSTDISRQQTASGQLSAELGSRSGIPTREESPGTTFSGAAQLSYNIYTSGARSARIRAAEEQLRFDELDVERLSAEISLQVAIDYYDLQQADEQVRINRAAVENAQRSLKDAQALETAGVGTRFDVLRFQVNLANAQQELTNSISQQLVIARRLSARLNLPQSANISAADAVKLSSLWNQTLEESIILAFQNRPELRQQLAQRNINEQQRRLANSEVRPQVSLIASYNLLDVFNDRIGITDGYSLGVRANWNLFDGGAARARTAQSKANIAISENRFSEQRNQIRYQVEQSYSNLQSNLSNVQTATVALNQAREALTLARLRFQAGVGTQTDVIASETELTRAEGNRVRAILDYNRALAGLQRSVSSPNLK